MSAARPLYLHSSKTHATSERNYHSKVTCNHVLSQYNLGRDKSLTTAIHSQWRPRCRSKRQTEVCQVSTSIVVEQDVGWRNVAMADGPCVAVVHGNKNLGKPLPHLQRWCEAITAMALLTRRTRIRTVGSGIGDSLRSAVRRSPLDK